MHSLAYSPAKAEREGQGRYKKEWLGLGGMRRMQLDRSFKTREQLAEEGRKIRERYAKTHGFVPEQPDPTPSYRPAPTPSYKPTPYESPPRPFDQNLWDRRVREARTRRADEERELREKREQMWREQAKKRQAEHEEHLKRERERAERQRRERENAERQQREWERANRNRESTGANRGGGAGGGSAGASRMRPELSPEDAQWLLDTIGYKAKRFQDMGEEDMPEFKRAYKKAVLRLHPDKVRQRGGSEEDIREADEAFKRVHEVYGEILAVYDKHLDAMLDALYAIRHRVATLERRFAGAPGTLHM